THPLARQEAVSTADLRAASWCLRESPSLNRENLIEMLGGAGLKDLRLLTNTHEAMKVAVKAGLHLGFASTRVIAREVADGGLVIINGDTLCVERNFMLMAPKRVYQGALQKAFIDHLRKWFTTERPPVDKMRRPKLNGKTANGRGHRTASARRKR